MRKLATLQKIVETRPIEGADAIEVTVVLGWEVVTKKGQFVPGDTAVYIEIDSIVPECELFKFLEARKWRVRTIKLRGQVSQGILFSIAEIESQFGKLPGNGIDYDLTEFLGIKKYEPEAEDNSVEVEPVFVAKTPFGKWKQKQLWKIKKMFGIQPLKYSFPEFIPKTDETRIQSIAAKVENHIGKEFYITEKLEGQSTTLYWLKNTKPSTWTERWNALWGKNDHFGICSRNMEISPRSNDNRFGWAKEKDLHEKMRKLGRQLAIQGEHIGPGIQKNIYGLSKRDIRVFLIYDIDAKKYCGYEEMIYLTELLGLQTVPVLEERHVLATADVKYWVEKSKLISKLANTKVEGIVVRMRDGAFSFKSINPDYLLGQKD